MWNTAYRLYDACSFRYDYYMIIIYVLLNLHAFRNVGSENSCVFITRSMRMHSHRIRMDLGNYIDN